MGDFGIAEIIALAGLATTAATTAYGMANKPGQPKVPTPQPQDMSSVGRAMLPGSRANAAASTGGGMAPEFMQNLLQQQTGDPGLNVLGDIRKSLNLPEGP